MEIPGNGDPRKWRFQEMEIPGNGESEKWRIRETENSEGKRGIQEMETKERRTLKGKGEL